MNSVLIVAALAFAVFFFNPKLLKSPLWRATVTPLASIIGSGFLVAGPILAHAAGNLAWAAMAGLCALAYLFGAAIRYNIVHVEPELDNGPRQTLLVLEHASDLALSFAYFISVAYYLNLFAAFGLRIGDVTDTFWIRVGSTAIIAFVGTVGVTGGLAALERLEIGAVGLKLSLIGGLCAALIATSIAAVMAQEFGWNAPQHPHGATELRILLGLVILVQGFETSRYLGDTYDTTTRVKTMRWAQWISSGIYIAFILLVTAYFTGDLPEEGGETAIIDMLMPVGADIGPLIIAVALASQLSAAVADMNGAGGLLSESSRGRIPVNLGNLLVALVAIAITWSANIYEIITYASKAFVVYYMLQSVEASWSNWKRKRFGMSALFAAGVVIALFIVLFAEPADV
jgi:hypothetical protein